MNRLLSCCSLAICVLNWGCTPSNQPSPPRNAPAVEQTATDEANADDEQIIEGVPGRKGQPPQEVTKFVAPIKLIAAGEHWDGGTTWVVLEDQRGAKLLFCVTQDAFESEIKANSLFIGADNAAATSARRPLSERECNLVVDSLKSAVESQQTEKLKDFAKQGYDPLEYQNQERFTVPESERFSEQHWHVLFAAHALDRLGKVEKQELADQKELAQRVAELESVDLESASAQFRSKQGTSRHAAWERLEPIFAAELRAQRPADPRQFITKLLGDGDAAAEQRNAKGMDPLETAAEGSVLAYNLESEDNFHQDLVFHFGDEGGVSYGVVAIAEPTPRDDPHDRITEDEKKLASQLGATSINLGGGSLDGTYKSGFMLGFKGDGVTDENLQSAMQLSTLVSLYLDGPHVTNERLLILDGHAFLASLKLDSTSVTDEGLAHLAKLPALKFLTLQTPNVTKAGVEQLQAALPHCEIDWTQASESQNSP